MDADRKKKLQERARKKRLVREAERVDFAEGEAIVGELVDVRTMDTDYGPLDVAYLLDGDTVTSVPLGHTALETSWREEGVEIGDDVLVEYLGERESESTGQSYHDYLVAKV
jgi:hypothetical protein